MQMGFMFGIDAIDAIFSYNDHTNDGEVRGGRKEALYGICRLEKKQFLEK